MVKDFCDKAFFINIDKHDGRAYRTKMALASIGVTADRFSAIIEYRPHIGCRKSHQAIIKMAKDNNWDRVIIFEDDIVFTKDATDIFDAAVKQLPEEWDLLYFGCRPGTLDMYSTNLRLIRSCKLSHAVIYNKSCYDIILASEEKSMDRTNLLVHPRNKSFCIYPMICEQEDKRICQKM